MAEIDKSAAKKRPVGVLLEKKHSTGDLQSRLKTRKILGVGETDNGDVHRSKISQVLGHNEHLYIKFPRYYSAWHVFLASLYTICGMTNVIIFHRNAKGTPPFESKPSLSLTEEYGRLYGCEMLGFAVLLWTLWGRSDKSLARALMTAIAVSESLQVGVVCLSLWNGETQWSVRMNLRMVFSAMTALVNLYFIWAIGSSTAGLRKAPSYRDVAEEEPDDGTTCQECHSPLIKSNCTTCNTKKID